MAATKKLQFRTDARPLKKYLYLHFLHALSLVEHRRIDWNKVFREFAESGIWTSPGPWIRRSYMDFLRVRTPHLLPGNKHVEKIYSGTFEDSDRCPGTPREEPYLYYRMDQDFAERAREKHDYDCYSDEESSEDERDEEYYMPHFEVEAQRLVPLGLDEDDNLRTKVERIRRATPPVSNDCGI
jgi:hypothetical protein